MAGSPLLARELILGTVEVWRAEGSPPFDEDDVRLLHELASRAALSVDNARRFTRERTSTVALQRSMLPNATTDITASTAAGVYLPATEGGREVGGDWYDVIALPSLRIAFVVGGVVGHGLRATATMGRMRTAVQTLADLDLTPDELLTHLDDLVLRTLEDTEPPHEDALSGTCLYAVYDPVSRRCAMASAGHPPPALVRTDGSVDFVALDPGPPLGVGGLPFEVTEFELAPDSVLAFYSRGLVEHGESSPAEEMEAFRGRLASLKGADCGLEAAAARLLDGLVPTARTEDVALLFAHVHAVTADRIASWEIPVDPAAVAAARALATEQLAAWGVDLAFTTELVVSELVTNAIRYAGGPLTLRLIRDDHTLVCEVSDPSNSQPRLRRARITDEGGRGLLLVAQLTTRWGSRYGSSGKTIWTEQALPAAS
jgi:serine phosphatase RsbU (regulator of sigma subunit)/anti-sigma regulatory factor (Ser/Thr protein kinase)